MNTETWEDKCKRIVEYHNGQAIELLRQFIAGEINYTMLGFRAMEELRIADSYQEKLEELNKKKTPLV